MKPMKMLGLNVTSSKSGVPHSLQLIMLNAQTLPQALHFLIVFFSCR